jgi:CBS domain containing-hemolysin-like protein
MELLLAALAIGLQAVFSGSETGLVRSNWVRVSTWANENRPGAKGARRMLDRKEATLIAALAGSNLFIILSSSLSERFFIHTLGPGYTFASVLLVTAVALFFAQFLPKAIASTWPERWLCIFSAPLRLARRVLGPLVWLLGRISGVRPARKSEFNLTRTDMLFALRESVRAAGTSTRLSGIAARLLDFPNVTVGDVMTPNDRVKAIPEEMTAPELRQLVRQYPYTRYPVYRGVRDNVTGVISVRDLLLTSQRIARKPFFVSPQARAIEVMNQMREKGEHLAIVADAQQRMVGIVALEDLLEELVGEIRSEE